MNWVVALEVVALICLGCGVVYGVKRFVKDQLSDPLVLSLLLVPMLLYGLTTGKITELSGFGLSAKAAQTARTPVSELNVPAEKLKIQYLTSDEPNFQLAALFEACADYFVVRPSQVPSDDEEFADYVANVTYAVRSSIACGRFAGLVVLDKSDRYIGSYGRSFFVESTSVWAVPNSSEPCPSMSCQSA